MNILVIDLFVHLIFLKIFLHGTDSGTWIDVVNKVVLYFLIQGEKNGKEKLRQEFQAPAHHQRCLCVEQNARLLNYFIK